MFGCLAWFVGSAVYGLRSAIYGLAVYGPESAVYGPSCVYGSYCAHDVMWIAHTHANHKTHLQRERGPAIAI